MQRDRLTIGTRGSQLAIRQAETIRSMLVANTPDIKIELQIIQTKGDLVLDRALSRIGDKGLFVSEIEQALRIGAIDIAVHSCKDLPAQLAPEFVLAAFPARADARDALISRHGLSLADLPHGARIGTSSLRRSCLLRAFRADFEVVNLRGNVDTRLRKASTEAYDAIVLAAAGLDRLGLSASITQLLEPEVMLPAVAQGALAVQCRTDDDLVRRLLVQLDDLVTRTAVEAERSFLARLEGGCQVPIAAYAVQQSGGPGVGEVPIVLRGMIGMPDGTQVVHGERIGTADRAETLGLELAEELLARGGKHILLQLSGSSSQVDAPEQV